MYARAIVPEHNCSRLSVAKVVLDIEGVGTEMLELLEPKEFLNQPNPSFIFLLLLSLTIYKQMICFESSFHLILELFDLILWKISNVYCYHNQSIYGLDCINFFFLYLLNKIHIYFYIT